MKKIVKTTAIVIASIVVISTVGGFVFSSVTTALTVGAVAAISYYGYKALTKKKANKHNFIENTYTPQRSNVSANTEFMFTNSENKR